MKLYYSKPVGYEVKRRTFEGKTNPDKNGDSLTSKYYPSYKYWIQIEHDDGTVIIRTKRTKKECVEYFQHCLSIAGKPL